MALRLECVGGNARGTEIVVEDELLIGRQSPSAGALAGDDEISRQHARIVRTPEGGYVIEDLASTNGTWINGKRIEGPQEIADGDTIDVGATTLVARQEAPPEPAREVGAATVVPPPVAAPDVVPVEEPVTDAAPAAPEVVPEPEPQPVAAAPEPITPEPALEEAAPATATVPPLRLGVDFETREVTLEFGDVALRLVHDEHGWHQAD